MTVMIHLPTMGGVHLPCGQTDTCKNITFPQLLLRTVKIILWVGEHKVYATYALNLLLSHLFCWFIKKSQTIVTRNYNDKYIAVPWAKAFHKT